MDTIISNKVSATPAKTAAAPTTKKAESILWKKAEEARFGIVPLLLTLIACLGGVAAAFGTNDSAFQLGVVTLPMMLTLSFILAVSPMRLIVWGSVVAIVADILVLLF